MSFIKQIALLLVTILMCSCNDARKATVSNVETEVLSGDSQPNIIFIFADDWGYGDLGVYGNSEIETPNLDKMASEGTRFTQFHVTSGVCSPSRASVLTGHFPARHRVHGHFAGNEVNAKRNMPNYLNDSLPVYLPQIMQKAGYVTAHFGKWHLGGGGKPHGDPLAPEPKVYGYDETRVWNGNGPTWKGDQKWPTTRYMDSDTLWVQSSSRIAVDETIDFIKRNKGKQPMFVNLWLKDPHTPLWPSEKQRESFKGLSPSKETYYAVLKDADFHVGRLLSFISEMGLDDNTLIVFSSDNGPAGWGPSKEAGSTAGLKGRKVDIFQGGVVVPFIVKWKHHVEENKVDSTSVLSTVDLLPTFASLAQTELPSDYSIDGENISSILANNSFNRTKPLFWEWRFPKETTNQWAQGAVRKGKWKLLFNDNLKREALYDISKDPFEKNSLAESNKQLVNEFKTLWKAWKNELPK
ncbi:sulfatase-like hydrolase/transferase [Winogradskyella eckloniae]|uniref:sulfatase family protein n=1 Tax=Winogradskyella eckloniae TaxID=1089306 RepID=UPI001566CCBB|nr:sulfatase-like hydrolase/transferase [Winogradskyella eckloniae]NRD20715.1 sulfatase-like hydrolase/transferase [Winogradskyella eckloniae]